MTYTVQKIDDQGDRVLLYKDTSRIPYYVIATPDQARGIAIGDTIECEEGGVNFGFFVAKV